MLKEIYFRDPSDNKYYSKGLEISNKMETLLSKLRMLLYTNRGEVLGEPDLGMDLDNYLFDNIIDVGEIKNNFYAQVAKFIPEHIDYSIDCSVSIQTDGVHNIAHLYITIDDQKVLGIEF